MSVSSAKTRPLPLSQPSERIAHFQQDVWSIFSPMAAHCQAVNLGQGFPNFETSEFVKEAACEAVRNNVNQYAPPKGLLRLRRALAQEYGPLLNRSQLDVESEIMISAGANEGMFAVFQAFLNEGSEVICFEPFFDQYAPNITMSGGKMVYCPLQVRPGADPSKDMSAHDWVIDMQQLESLITPRTKMLVLNTPHNPVGKVFRQQELEQIAEIAIRHDLMVISDEVYDRLIYDNAQHLRIATLPGMWERTITVGSAGKSFAVTGWRVGWLLGPKSLLHHALIAHSRIVFCTNSPLQEAIASSFKQTKTNGFFEKQVKEYQRKRDFLLNVFRDIGLPVTVPEGSYFILVNVSKLKVPDEELMECEEMEAKFCLGGVVPRRSRDWKICRWLTVKVGVAAIPPSEFYGPENAHLAESYARFCFCKTDETLQAAKERLQLLKQYVQTTP